MKLGKREKKASLIIATAAAVFASLCCLTPIILVLFGLSSVAFAASLGNLFYGTYKWAFRGAGLVFALIALVVYFRRQKICTLDDCRQHKNMIISMIALTIVLFVLVYIVFNYVILEVIGIKLKLWTLPFERLLEYF